MDEQERQEISALLDRLENMTGDRAVQYALVAIGRILLSMAPRTED